MDVSKLFFIFIYSSVFLILKDVWAGLSREGKSQSSGSSPANSSQSSSTNASQSSPAEGTDSSQTQEPQVAENPLDFNDLKDEYGILKVIDLDGFKFTFFRAFVGKSFNKFKLGDLALWPEKVSKESIYEFHMISKDNKYLLTLSSLKREGYLNHTCLFIKPESSDSNNMKVENLDRANSLEKFSQFVGNVFKVPWPEGLVKDTLFQDWYAYHNKTADNKVPDDLDVI